MINLVVAPERLLPLVLVGFAVGMLPPPRFAACAMLLVAGCAAGILLPRIDFDRFFLPMLFVTAGLALIGGPAWREQVLPPASLIIGVLAGYGLAPSLNGVSASFASLGGTLAPPLAAAMIARALYRPWFAIPARIGGSWLVAIGIIFTAVLVRPGTAPGANALVVAPVPVHDSNLPHIHAPDGTVIYLQSGHGGQDTVVRKRGNAIDHMFGNARQP